MSAEVLDGSGSDLDDNTFLEAYRAISEIPDFYMLSNEDRLQVIETLGQTQQRLRADLQNAPDGTKSAVSSRLPIVDGLEPQSVVLIGTVENDGFEMKANFLPQTDVEDLLRQEGLRYGS